jgi:hypothetical protein
MERKPSAGQIALTIAGAWCMFNAAFIGALGIATLLGNRLVFEAGGVGPNRIAPASLLGPFTGHAGWALLVLSAGIGVVAYGLVRRRPWSRRVLMVIVAFAAVSAMIAMVWAAQRGDWTTAAWGAAKLVLYVAIGFTLRWRRTRALFS